LKIPACRPQCLPDKRHFGFAVRQAGLMHIILELMYSGLAMTRVILELTYIGRA